MLYSILIIYVLELVFVVWILHKSACFKAWDSIMDQHFKDTNKVCKDYQNNLCTYTEAKAKLEVLDSAYRMYTEKLWRL